MNSPESISSAADGLETALQRNAPSAQSTSALLSAPATSRAGKNSITFVSSIHASRIVPGPPHASARRISRSVRVPQLSLAPRLGHFIRSLNACIHSLRANPGMHHSMHSGSIALAASTPAHIGGLPAKLLVDLPLPASSQASSFPQMNIVGSTALQTPDSPSAPTQPSCMPSRSAHRLNAAAAFPSEELLMSVKNRSTPLSGGASAIGLHASITVFPGKIPSHQQVPEPRPRPHLSPPAPPVRQTPPPRRRFPLVHPCILERAHSCQLCRTSGSRSSPGDHVSFSPAAPAPSPHLPELQAHQPSSHPPVMPSVDSRLSRSGQDKSGTVPSVSRLSFPVVRNSTYSALCSNWERIVLHPFNDPLKQSKLHGKTAAGITLIAGLAAGAVLYHAAQEADRRGVWNALAARCFRNQDASIDGMLLDIARDNLWTMDQLLTMLEYKYRSAGVDYECSQDVHNTAHHCRPQQRSAPVSPVPIRYQPGNPAEQHRPC